MRVKNGVTLKKVGSTYMAVAPVADGVSDAKMLKLNESGAFLLKKAIELGVDVKILADTLVSEYAISAELALADTKRFVNLLEQNGLCDNEQA